MRRRSRLSSGHSRVKAADSTRGGGPAVPASKEGNVGEYWYHGDTAAYVPDEQQDQEATDACKKTRPRYLLWVSACAN